MSTKLKPFFVLSLGAFLSLKLNKGLQGNAPFTRTQLTAHACIFLGAHGCVDRFAHAHWQCDNLIISSSWIEIDGRFFSILALLGLVTMSKMGRCDQFCWPAPLNHWLTRVCISSWWPWFDYTATARAVFVCCRTIIVFVCLLSRSRQNPNFDPVAWRLCHMWCEADDWGELCNQVSLW